MDAVRFRFDGVPINPEDTPADVSRPSLVHRLYDVE